MMIDNLSYARVVCFTDTLSFYGVILTGKRRLRELLNDRTTEYVELGDVEVYKVHDPDVLFHRTQELFLRKSSLVLVVIQIEVSQTPASRLFSYVAKQRHDAVLFLPTYEVRGTLHLTGKYQVHGPLAAEGEAFIPVTNAQATAVLNTRVKLQADTVLVRQDAINAFYVAEGGTV